MQQILSGSASCGTTADSDFLARSIADRVESVGYCIVQAQETDADVLLELIGYFGQVQGHVRSDERGIVNIKCDSTASDVDRSQYLGLTAGAFAPHTDGTYLSGVGPDHGSVRRIGPP